MNYSAKSAQDESYKRQLDMLDISLGDIRPFFHDDTVTEVILNADGSLWVQKVKEGLYDTGLKISADHAINIINICATMVHDTCNFSKPNLSAEMPESGFRFEANITPITLGPSFVIRKFSTSIFTLDDYIKFGTVSRDQYDYIRKSVLDKKNIVVCGATDSGKTTFMKTLLNEIPANERIIVIEDTRELKCKTTNILYLKTVPKIIDMAMLLKSTLRLRPDRIILGEVRGGEALVMLKSWGTGHPGGICSYHSSPGIGALYRLEQMIQEAVPHTPRELIGETINLIVHLEKDPMGTRVVDDISIVRGFDGKNYLLERIEL